MPDDKAQAIDNRRLARNLIKDTCSFMAIRVNSMNSTKEPVAFVTGASIGIGLATRWAGNPIRRQTARDITSTRQIRLEMRSPYCWRVTFDHPPLNIFGPETIPQFLCRKKSRAVSGSFKHLLTIAENSKEDL
jgi:hypothetical protein